MHSPPSHATGLALPTFRIAACSLRQVSSSAPLHSHVHKRRESACRRRQWLTLWKNAGKVLSSHAALLSVCAETARSRRWLDTRNAASEGTSLGALALPWTFAGQLAAAVGTSRNGEGAAREFSSPAC